MWLSKMLSRENEAPLADEGIVTNSDGSSVEASSSVNAGGISSFSPYGYAANIPNGEEVILIASAKGNAALGVKNAFSELERGEVCITSKGGASILLKNNGDVIINGKLGIDKEGDVFYEL